MADDEILRSIKELMADIRAQNLRAENVHERNRVAFEGMMDALARFQQELSIEFQKNREAYELNREASDRNTEAFDRNTEVHRDLRQFIREILLRNELAMDRLIEKIEGRLPPATP